MTTQTATAAVTTEQTATGRARKVLRTTSISRVATVVAPVLTFVVLGFAWNWVAKAQPSVLPPLGDVFGDLVGEPGFYWRNLAETLQNALFGGLAGCAVALLLAVIVVHVRWLHSAIMPVAALIHATPIVAIAPALVVAFGFDRTPHVIVVALTTFFPMLINAIAGLRAVDRDILEVFESMSASRADVFFRLRVPASLGHLFAGAKIAVMMAMIGAIVSEFTGTNKGLGAVVVQATSYLNLVQMWGAIFVSAGVSLMLLGVVILAEKLVVRW